MIKKRVRKRSFWRKRRRFERLVLICFRNCLCVEILYYVDMLEVFLKVVSINEFLKFVDGEKYYGIGCGCG